MVLRIFHRDSIMKVHRPFCEMPVNSCMISINLLFYRLIKYADIKFNGNPSSVSRVFFPCEWTDRQRWTDMTKLMVAFRNFVNAPKNYNLDSVSCSVFALRNSYLRCPVWQLSQCNVRHSLFPNISLCFWVSRNSMSILRLCVYDCGHKHVLTCQRLIFRRYREPARENLTSSGVYRAGSRSQPW